MVPLARDVVVQFAEEQSWTKRAKFAEQAAMRFLDGGLSPAEHQAALDLFRLAIYDGEALVRRVLAESIKHARALPRDIVRALVNDLPEVSAPFLACSPLIAEEDLVRLAKTGGTLLRAAIACRPSLSERLADALLGEIAAA